MKQVLMMVTAATAGMCLAMPAAAQQRVPQGQRWVTMPARSTPPQHRADPRRWGDRIDGRWSAGARAPGGWSAYRRPVRGWQLPRYWMGSPDFRIADYINWGLAAPPYGYFWVRYYDDAVLTDRDGRVWDSVDGIDWYGGASAHAYSESYASAGATSGATTGANYAPPPPPPAGNRIPTVDPDLYYDDSYLPGGGDVPPAAGVPPVVHYAPPPPSYAERPRGCTARCGGSGAFYGGAQYYVPSTTTTIIIQSAPVTTTTVIEETVVEEVTTTYAPTRTVRRSPVSRVYVK